jgi:hypothetical protein
MAERYVTVTVVVVADADDPTWPLEEVLADRADVMFWSAEDGVTDAARDAGADPDLWTPDPIDPTDDDGT